MTTRLSTLLQTFGLQAIGPQDDPVLTAITPDSRAVNPARCLWRCRALKLMAGPLSPPLCRTGPLLCWPPRAPSGLRMFRPARWC